ncbi:uncharacterized protein LOC125491471 [Plutella xylostella]|uniref:uncharacterized protein LOC125491471 n=1 Tax=Plutella xylostella TaxID=51655 RepID=UPI002032CD3E|nr:uncharacterized protein LOC125491471 [Plutella xylostella]
MPRNRDKNLTVPQQQLGSGITAINRAMEVLLKGQDTSTAIKHLSNACRILSDLHHMNTQSRIKLITPGLDRSFLHVIQDAERDETIFGNKLSEKIKAAKAIEKQGIQIKKVTAPNPKPSSSTHVQTPVVRPTYSGNWTAPPRYSSNRGGGREAARRRCRAVADRTMRLKRTNQRPPPTTDPELRTNSPGNTTVCTRSLPWVQRNFAESLHPTWLSTRNVKLDVIVTIQ